MADGRNRVRSVGKGRDLQARRDDRFHLTPVPLPPSAALKGASGAKAERGRHRPGRSGRGSTRGLIQSKGHTPLIHVGRSKHEKSAGGAPGPEAQLSEEVGNDHPHARLDRRRGTSSARGGGGGRACLHRGWGTCMPTPPPRRPGQGLSQQPQEDGKV